MTLQPKKSRTLPVPQATEASLFSAVQTNVHMLEWV